MSPGLWVFSVLASWVFRLLSTWAPDPWVPVSQFVWVPGISIPSHLATWALSFWVPACLVSESLGPLGSRVSLLAVYLSLCWVPWNPGFLASCMPLVSPFPWPLISPLFTRVLFPSFFWGGGGIGVGVAYKFEFLGP